MNTKEQLIQEIEQASELLLQEVLEFIRSRQVSPIAPVETFLYQVRERGDYADDVTPEELAASEAAYQDYLAGRKPVQPRPWQTAKPLGLGSY